jgi:hypothetical protein
MATMTAEEAAEWGKTLNFEKVWAAIMETDRIVKANAEEIKRFNEETDRKIAASVAQIKRSSEETDRKIAESAGRADQRIVETAEELKKAIKKMSKNIGGINNSMGKWTEQMAAAKLWKRFDKFGFVFTKEGISIKFRDKNGRPVAEVDIFLENGMYVMAVEVKFDLRTEDVDEHLERIKKVRSCMDERGDGRKIVGAVAGAIVPANVRAYAQKKGLYVIVPSGNAVAVADAPEGFTRKEW